MAAAIVTVVRGPEPPGNRRTTIVDFTFSTSYPAGGEPMTPSLFGLQVVDAVLPMGSQRASAAVHTVFRRDTGALELYTSSTGALVATGSDQSSNKVTLQVIGL